jgi:hypothetical protein
MRIALLASLVACGGAEQTAASAGGRSGAGSGGNGAGAGSSDGGNAGGSTGASGGTGGNGGGGGSAGSPGDPDPINPDMTGRIPTSTQWVLFTESRGALVPGQLFLLDVPSKTRHLTNPDGPEVSYTSWSPDGKSFLLSSANATAEQHLRLIRLSDAGFVPASRIEGYAGVRGNFSRFDWSADSRFVVAQRNAGPTDGIEVIDTARKIRIANTEFTTNFGFELARAGFHYSQWHDPGGGTRELAFSRITNAGVTPPTKLRTGATGLSFDHEGKRLFYTVGEGKTTTFEYIDLPATTAQPLTVPPNGETHWVYFIGPAGSLLAGRARADGTIVYRRLFVDSNRPSEVLSDPAGDVDLPFPSQDSAFVLFSYADKLELVRVEPLVRHTLPEWVGMPQTFAMHGHYAHYTGRSGLRLATVDANGALVDVAITAPGQVAQVCTSVPGKQLETKLAVVIGGGEQLLFVDLSASSPRVAGTLSRSGASATLFCPLFARDGSAFAVTELNGTASKLFLGRWSGAAPEAPVLVHESTNELSPYALMFR